MVRSEFVEVFGPEDGARRIVSIARRRLPPRFIICDAALHVMFSTAGLGHILDASSDLESLRTIVRETIHSSTPNLSAFDDETVLRIVPLGEELAGCAAIFVDAYSHRGSVFEAAKAFGLTKRETQVLRLIITGKSSLQMAKMLFVAESTVSDHVKSVMRKMMVSKRVEILSKLFNLEHDLVDERN